MPKQSPSAPILDEVTGVYSIEYFEHQMRSQVAFALRRGHPVSVILFSVDLLDDLTLAYGRDGRESILAGVAEMVRQHVRDEDVLARYGRDEFALLCLDTPAKAAAFLATRIRQSVEAGLVHHGDLELPVTISLGVATIPPGVKQDSGAVGRAEDALARAREKGNTVVAADGDE